MIHFAVGDRKDLPAIIQVMENTKYNSYRFGNKNPEEILRVLEKEFSHKIFLVAYTGFIRKKIIGYALYTSVDEWDAFIPGQKPRKDFAYGSGIGIHSHYRGKSVAIKLKKYAEGVLKGKGFKGIYVDVASTNGPSLHLQEKCGYRELARFLHAHRPIGVKNVVFAKEF